MTRPPATSPAAASAVSLACLLLLAACSGRPAREAAGQAGAPTLAQLSTAPVAAPAPGGVDTPRGREKAIAGYRAYLARYPDRPDNDRIARRLADLLLESASDRQAGEPLADEGRVSPDAGVRARYDEAIAIYRRLLAKEPGGREESELLYQLSRAYQESDRPQQAIGLVDRLLKQATGSDVQLQADIRFRRGELLFQQGDYGAAAAAYRAVVKPGDTVPVYEQALYKLGWSLFKDERYGEALDAFFSLLDRKLPAGADLGSRLAALSPAAQEQLEDVFRVISMSFAQQAGVASVAAWFRRHGSRSYENRIYLDLADFYVDQDQVSDAAATWLALARREPLSAEAPRLYIRAIELYRKAGFRPRVLETGEQLVRRYGPNSDFWRQHAPAGFGDVQQQLQSSLIELAAHYHARATETQRPEDYRRAEQWYREYLAAFGTAATATEMNFQLAELLYQTRQYRLAAEEYERTAWSRGEDVRARQAGQAALHAWAQYLKQPDIPDREMALQRATTAAVRFVSSWPDSPDAAAVLAQTGAELLARGDYRQAARIGEQFSGQDRSLPPPLRSTAWSLRAQAQFRLGDYREAEQAYRQALLLAGRGGRHSTALNEGLAAALYKQAQQQQADGKSARAVMLYREAARVAPDAALRARAQYDAATALLAQEEWDEAIAILEAFGDDYPRHPLRLEAARKLAWAYDRSGRRLSAAGAYRALAKSRSDAGLQREALLRAAVLYREAGQDREAVTTLEMYLRRFPKPPDAAIAAMQTLAELAGAGGDTARRRQWLTKIVSLDRSAGGDTTRPVAARAMLELAESARARFRRIRLVEPLQKSLAAKLREMKRALKDFEAAMDYGVPGVSSAAAFHIADMYDELGEELLTSQRPASLDAEALAQYEKLLQQQAAPFARQAMELHAANVRRGEARPDRWTEKSRQRLEVLQARRHEGPDSRSPEAP